MFSGWDDTNFCVLYYGTIIGHASMKLLYARVQESLHDNQPTAEWECRQHGEQCRRHFRACKSAHLRSSARHGFVRDEKWYSVAGRWKRSCLQYPRRSSCEKQLRGLLEAEEENGTPPFEKIGEMSFFDLFNARRRRVADHSCGHVKLLDGSEGVRRLNLSLMFRR